MCLALHTEAYEGMNATLKWLYASECDGGGISAWKMPDGRWHTVYPEITGYVLPTLIKWGAGDLAIRSADFLLSIQNHDGSFNGIDGIPHPFDTSAIIEGLMVMYEHTTDVRYYKAAESATEWMYTQISSEGYLYNSPQSHTPHIYNLRASSIIGNYREGMYWKHRKLITDRERTHYLAYALEGALNDGEKEWAMQYIELAYRSNNRLQPFYVSYDWQPMYADFDICASAQMAILFHRVGLDVERHYAAIKHHVTENGGVPQSTSDARQISWGAKFYLDLAYLMGDVK